MNPEESVSVTCPYCNEVQQILVDCSVEEQSYVEDCQVCCSPIELWVNINLDGAVQVDAARENA